MSLGLGIMLMLTAWLGWTAATNIPFMPDGLHPVEAKAWPMVTFLGAVGFGAGTLADLRHDTVWRALAALCLALVTGLLTLRLIFLPLSATLSPLSLIGLREALTGFFLIYAAYAALTWQRAGARSP